MRGRRRVPVVGALLVLASGCGDGAVEERTGDEPRSTTTEATTTTVAASTTTATTTVPAPTTAPVDPSIGIDGSRHLAQVVIPDARSEPELRLLDLVTGESRLVAAGAGRVTDVHVSADGSRVAWFEAADEFGPGLVRIGRSADEAPVVVDATAACPAWLPDGDLLVTNFDEAGGVSRVDPATGVATRLPFRFGDQSCVTPMGTDHVLSVRNEGTEEAPAGSVVRRSPLDGGRSEVVADLPDHCWVWGVSADATTDRVAATVTCVGDPANSGIWMAAAGGELAPLITEGSHVFRCEYSAPTWSATGATILYHRLDPTGEQAPTVWRADPATGQAAPRVEGEVGGFPSLSAG